MFRLAIIPCQNGLGHIKRSSIIAENLIKKKINVSFFCDTNKKKFIKKKFIKQIKLSNKLSDFKTQRNARLIKKINFFDKFNLIYTDNIEEIALKTKNLVFFANFFWSKIYKNKSKIYTRIEKIINKNKITIFCNYLFFNKHIQQKGNKITKVGFFQKFIGRIHYKKNILVSTGTADNPEIKNFKKKFYLFITANKKKLKNFTFFVDRKIFKKNFKHGKIVLAKYDHTMFKKISSAIIKPGFSIISDCLRYGITIYCYNKRQNNEFKYNSKIIKYNHLGITELKFDNLLKKCLNISKDRRKYYFYKYKNLKWQGNITIEKFIIDYASKNSK